MPRRLVVEEGKPAREPLILGRNGAGHNIYEQFVDKEEQRWVGNLVNGVLYWKKKPPKKADTVAGRVSKEKYEEFRSKVNLCQPTMADVTAGRVSKEKYEEFRSKVNKAEEGRRAGRRTSDEQQKEMLRLGCSMSDGEVDGARMRGFAECMVCLQRQLERYPEGAILDIGIAGAHRLEGGSQLPESCRTGAREEEEPFWRGEFPVQPSRGRTWAQLSSDLGYSSKHELFKIGMGGSSEVYYVKYAPLAELLETDMHGLVFDRRSGIVPICKLKAPPQSEADFPHYSHAHHQEATGGIRLQPASLCGIYFSGICRMRVLALMEQGELCTQTSPLPIVPMPLPAHVEQALREMEQAHQAPREVTMEDPMEQPVPKLQVEQPQRMEQPVPKLQVEQPQREVAAPSASSASGPSAPRPQRHPRHLRSLSTAASGVALLSPLGAYRPSQLSGSAVLRRQVVLHSRDPDKRWKDKYYRVESYSDEDSGVFTTVAVNGLLDSRGRATSESMAMFRLTTNEELSEKGLEDKVCAKLAQGKSEDVMHPDNYKIVAEYSSGDAVAVPLKLHSEYKPEKHQPAGPHVRRLWEMPMGPTKAHAVSEEEEAWAQEEARAEADAEFEEEEEEEARAEAEAEEEEAEEPRATRKRKKRADSAFHFE